jgi:hypothetical protein
MVLLVLLLGFGVGFGVLFIDYFLSEWSKDQRDTANSSAFILWAGLICAQVALWTLALFWLLPSSVRLWKRYYRESKVELWLSGSAILGIILLIVAGFPGATSWPDYLPNHELKIGGLTVYGALVGLVAAGGIWLVHGGLKTLAKEHLATRSALDTFVALKSDLERFLAMLGAIIGLLVLSTGAHRRVVLAYAKETGEPVDYGVELVLVFGFFFSILVAAVYLPTHLTLIRVGNGIRDAFFPPVAPSSAKWEDLIAKREKLGGLLELQVGPLGRFKTSAAILTPLVGSLIALTFK